MNHFQKFYHNDLSKEYRRFFTEDGASCIKICNPTSISNLEGKFDKIILDNIMGDIKDVHEFLSRLRKHLSDESIILITYYNHLWEPILELASELELRKDLSYQNWLDESDMSNLLDLTGYEVITTHRRLLFPAQIPVLTQIINTCLANLPFFNNLCLSTFVYARPKPSRKSDYSVSIIIPAKNEAGNIEKIIPSIPKFGTKQEIIFIEGGSSDNTWNNIQKIANKHKDKKLTIKAFKQKGKGKFDAVKLGFSKSNNEILMIYDADRTVDAADLPKFYEVLSKNPNSFANGSRLVYPMEKQAMRILNKTGNKIFSYLFTWILGQKFKDTLCGTKALFKNDYLYIKKYYKKFFSLDPFGDFALIFGAVKKHLRVIEIPVRYRERSYGTTNINRVKHGLILFRMTVAAFKEFRT